MRETSLRLTRREQERLYYSVSEYLQGVWKSRRESLLHNMLCLGFYGQRARRTGQILPKEIEAVEHAREFKREYYRMKAELLRMKAAKLVFFAKKGSEVEARLTQAGKRYAAKRRLCAAVSLLPRGERLYVMFDVPEASRFTRSMIRAFLKSADFTMEQKSVWATNKNVEVPLRELLSEIGAGKWVSAIKGKSIMGAEPITRKTDDRHKNV